MGDDELELAESMVRQVGWYPPMWTKDVERALHRAGVTDPTVRTVAIRVMEGVFDWKLREWSCLRLYHSILLPLSGSRLMAATATDPDPLDGLSG